MKRPNWATRLADYIEDNGQMPFSYGQDGLDCCRFTWGAIQTQTGEDIGQQFRSSTHPAARHVYQTRREALRLMRGYCGRPSLVLSITKLMHEHGYLLVGANYAQRGDAMLAPQDNGEAFFGIVDLSGAHVVSVGEQGLVRRPITIRCRAWRVE